MAKESFLARLQKAAGAETSGLMRAILFGEKMELDENILEAFQRNGTGHVLAVSGLHVGIIYGCFSAVWRRKKGVAYFGFLTAFFVCYMSLANFSPSVVRAVFMVTLHAFATITGRRYDLSSAAFFTALIMLIKNPMHLFNMGFQLSFLAVLTLSLITPIVKKLYSGIFLGSISIQLGLIPYTVYNFNYLSIGAVFINVPIIFLTGVIVPAGLCAMAVMNLSEPLFQLAANMISGLCQLLIYLNSVTSIDGITVFVVTSPDIKWVAFYYLILLCFVSEEGRLIILKRRKKLFLFLSAGVLFLTFAFGAVAGNRFKDADMIFVDVGQGDCMHLRMEDGKNYLIDGGGRIDYNVGKQILKPYLLKNGVRIVDGAFVTHLHTDHYKGIVELCREGMIKKLFVYEGNRVREQEILKETGLSKENLIYLYKGQHIKLGEDADIKVFWPESKAYHQYLKMAEDKEDENESSLILSVKIKGYGMIATGDVDKACLDQLSEVWGDDLKAHILKVAHHGSKYSFSESFTRAVSPEYAVFQVGKNNFGHPDKGVVENYLETGIMVYRNDKHGAIAFDFARDGSVEAMTVKGEEQ